MGRRPAPIRRSCAVAEDHGRADLLIALKLSAAMSNLKLMDLKRTLRLITFLDELRAAAVQHAELLSGEQKPPGRA